MSIRLLYTTVMKFRILVFVLIFLAGLGIGLFANLPKKEKIETEKNTPQAFVAEVYDKIKENYWDNISDAQLLELFNSALGEKFENKEKLLQFLDKNKVDSPKVIRAVLASLNPTGRSGLYTQKQEITLKNTVENRNPKTGKVEPTISNKIIPPSTFYVKFDKFSPTSLEEFQKAFDSHKDNATLSCLILDLRGNVGGAIDATSYFLGYFLGKGQYAFDFYHKGEYQPFKTQTDKLPGISKYKQVVVLVDQNTQSSAEMMAAALKKYHAGVVVGVPTKGWGTVEKVFPLDNQISKEEKYSIFLVHSITLRDDNQPIEGRGVEPDVDIRDPGWTKKLLAYFNNQTLVEAVNGLYGVTNEPQP